MAKANLVLMPFYGTLPFFSHSLLLIYSQAQVPFSLVRKEDGIGRNSCKCGENVHVVHVR